MFLRRGWVARRAIFFAALLGSLTVAAGCSRHAAPTPASSTAPAPITTGDFPAYGHAADFSWVAGRYTRSLQFGDCAFIVFSSTPDAPWGGKIALEARADVLAGFSDGDMIVVHGDFDRNPHGRCGPAAYVVRRIEEH